MELRAIALTGIIVLLGACSRSNDDDQSDPIVEPNTVTDPDNQQPTLPDGVVNFEGTRPSVEQIYSESQLAALETLGVQINLGDNPPNVEGTYRFDPVILQATSVPNEQGSVGNSFRTTVISFSNQDNTTLTLELATDSGNTNVVGTGSFISGTQNAFTVYFIAEVTQNGHTFDSTETYSGIVTAAGIENLQRSIFVIDDRGDPNDTIIPNDTGRLFIDLDGLTERVDDRMATEDADLPADHNSAYRN